MKTSNYKPIYLLVLLASIFLQEDIVGQSNKILSLRNQSFPNGNTLDSSDVVVPLDLVVFSDFIFQCFIDSTIQKIYLRTREKNSKRTSYKNNGFIGTLDVNTYQFDWQEKINYKKNLANIKGRYLVKHKARKDKMIDLSTGEEMWEVKNELSYIDSELGVGFGYKKLGFGRDLKKLEGVNLNNGEVIWKREINRRFGWREMFSVTDSTMIISGSGVHFLNVKSGDGWAIAQKAGKDSNNFFTGKKRYYNLGSNIVRDTLDGMMYHAAEEIIKFDLDGNLIWSTEIPIKELSKMYMYQDAQFLYLFNTGGADEAKLIYGNCGKPYIAKVDKETGNIIYRNGIFVEGKDYFYDIDYRSPTELVALSKDGLIVFNPSTGKMVDKSLLKKKIFGKQKRLITAEPYLMSAGVLTSLYDRYSIGLYNIKEETCHMLAKSGHYQGFDAKTLYFKNEISSDIDLIYGEEKGSYLLDKQGNMIAKLDVLRHPLVVKDKLYSFKDKRLHIHDLSGLKK